MKNKRTMIKNSGKEDKADKTAITREAYILIAVFFSLPLSIVIIIQAVHPEMTIQEGVMHYINLIPAVLMIFTLMYSVHHNNKIMQENQKARKEDNARIEKVLEMQAELLQEIRQDRKEHREDMKILIGDIKTLIESFPKFIQEAEKK